MELDIFYIKRDYTKENILSEIYILKIILKIVDQIIYSLDRWNWIYSIYISVKRDYIKKKYIV